MGTIFTQSNFVTLKYVTDPYSKTDNGFRLIVTAFKDTRKFIAEAKREEGELLPFLLFVTLNHFSLFSCYVQRS